MAQQCSVLTDGQRQAVLKARESFMAATRGRSQSTGVKPQADRQFHRQMRVAMVQALCEGINLSDDEMDYQLRKMSHPDPAGPAVQDPPGNA